MLFYTMHLFSTLAQCKYKISSNLIVADAPQKYLLQQIYWSHFFNQAQPMNSFRDILPYSTAQVSNIHNILDIQKFLPGI